MSQETAKRILITLAILVWMPTIGIVGRVLFAEASQMVQMFYMGAGFFVPLIVLALWKRVGAPSSYPRPNLFPGALLIWVALSIPFLILCALKYSTHIFAAIFWTDALMVTVAYSHIHEYRKAAKRHNPNQEFLTTTFHERTSRKRKRMRRKKH